MKKVLLKFVNCDIILILKSIAKGKGKTKHLLAKVNDAIKGAKGNIVYLDKSSKHMYELNNKVRLINVTDYGIENCDEFVGFICGIISQDHDLEELYFDSFLKIAGLEECEDLAPVFAKLDKISETYHINITISVSKDESELPEEVKSKIIVSL